MSNEQRHEHETLRLDQFLKLCGISGTGGQAKLLIQSGEVLVNGELETRRRRKLVAGDMVQFDGSNYSFDEFISDH
ncbi:MAG: RNA-binding S4 domain-containing protein [Planctomycetes bacterium]|nr:RNA-binding S4 domain-containing protein [Planctomycetota bacterium]